MADGASTDLGNIYFFRLGTKPPIKIVATSVSPSELSVVSAENSVAVLSLSQRERLLSLLVAFSLARATSFLPRPSAS
jgi:hypothetical protein